MSHPIPFTTIDRGDRVRQDHGDVTGLAQDIYTNGLIHPICITPDSKLIAGGRRSQALDHILANAAELTDDPETGPAHPDITRFIESGHLEFGIHYTHKSVLDEANLAELELIENVQRHALSWQEEVIAVSRIHSMRARTASLEASQWTQKQTGRLLGKSRASVGYCIEIAQQLRDETSPIWKCSGPVEAMQYLTKLKHDAASILLADRVKSAASTIPTNITASPTSSAELDSFVQKFNPAQFTSGGDLSDPSSEFGPTSAQPTAPIVDLDKDALKEALEVAQRIVHHCDCLELFKTLGPASVDHVITDPPYGIDMGMLAQNTQGQTNIDTVEKTHDVKSNEAAFPLWLQGCYDVLKPKGFCVWFCDQAQWQTLYEHAVRIGFKVQRWPLVWVKTSSCINQRAEYNFTKATEIAMVMRKEGGRLTSAQSVNYWSGGLTPEDKAANAGHPFAKPSELWKWLLKAVALPGSTVCDPFSGVGSSTRAMLQAGYMPVTSELEATHYAQQVNSVAHTYLEMKGVK